MAIKVLRRCPLTLQASTLARANMNDQEAIERYLARVSADKRARSAHVQAVCSALRKLIIEIEVLESGVDRLMGRFNSDEWRRADGRVRYSVGWHVRSGREADGVYGPEGVRWYEEKIGERHRDAPKELLAKDLGRCFTADKIDEAKRARKTIRYLESRRRPLRKKWVKVIAVARRTNRIADEVANIGQMTREGRVALLLLQGSRQRVLEALCCGLIELDKDIRGIEAVMERLFMEVNSTGDRQTGVMRVAWESRPGRVRRSGPKGPSWYRARSGKMGKRYSTRVPKVTKEVIQSCGQGYWTNRLMSLAERIEALAEARRKCTGAIEAITNILGSRQFKLPIGH